MRALVAFGTKYGTTGQVADEIAAVLRQGMTEVDVLDLRNGKCPDLGGYDLFVVGSAIHMGAWTKEADTFLKERSPELAKKRTSLFVCCGDVVLQRSPIDECRKKYLEDVAAKHSLAPERTGLFGGVLDFSKYGFLVKALLNGAKKDFERKGLDMSKPYDFRDWDQIRAWARSLM
ncbi:MAG: protoporphyrinogen oxidase [Methanomassiliicoccales archaeon PtaU1.Bin124]|nr:MAG: protoporphyrinogen oxidase [Methanomassiliicoccales archaeon PtaU1.Bin124]